MDKKMFRSCMLLIAFGLALVVAVVKIDVIGQGIGMVMGLLSPFFIGFAIAFVLNIPYKGISGFLNRQVRSAQGQKLVKPVAICGAYLLCLAIVGAITSFIIPELVNSISRLVGNIGTYIGNLEQLAYSLADRFQTLTIDFAAFEKEIKDLINQAASMLSNTMPQIFTFTAGIFQTMFNFLVGLILSVYMLASRDKLKDQAKRLLYAFFPRQMADKTMEVSRLTAECFARFISGQLTEACILGGLCFIGMSLFRFEYAFLISVMIGSTSIIPVVGAFIGAIPAVFLLLMVEPLQALWFIVFLVVLQQLEGNIIYPRVVGESIGLPAIWVMLAILVGGGLGGAPGMLMGVPVMTVIYKLLTQEAAERLAQKNVNMDRV